MKTVTRQYKQSMAKDFRNRSHCVVTFGNTDITAVTDGEWSGSVASVSSFETIDYEHTFHNTIATLELNRWALDGKTSVKRENDGYVASAMGASSLSKTFTLNHSLSGLTLTFDTRENEWPFAVQLDYYNTSHIVSLVDDDDNKFATDTLEPIVAYYDEQEITTTTTVYPTSNVCQLPLIGENVSKITITVLSVLPYRRARIEQVSWGVASVFNDSNLISVHQSHDVDPLSRRLPSETLEFVITDFDHQYDPDNPQGIYSTINKGAPVSVSFGYEVEDGETEWVKADKYSLLNEPTFQNSRVTFNCVGLIGTLTGYYYKDTYNANGKSLYSLATAVLTDAGLPLTSEGENPWEIDSTLQSMMTMAVLPIDTHANLLQLIAHAARCRLFTDDDNVIHIKPFGVTPTGIFDGTYSDSGHTEYSEWTSVDYGNPSLQSIATLELNRWSLDGSNEVTREQTGYVGSAVSGSNGSSTSYWEKSFDVSHDLPVLTLTFDEVGNTWPFKVEVQYYDASGLIATTTAYPTGTSIDITTENVDDCTRIKVTTYSLLPYTRNRLKKVSFRETDFTLKLDDVKQQTQSTTKIEKLKNVNVSEYSYSLGDSVTIYEADTTLLSLHLEFGASTNISVTVTGGTVTSQSIYAQAVDLVMSSGTKHVVITGKPINQSENVHTLAVGTSGEDDIEQNQLITNSDMASSLATHMKSYLTLRNTYDASYRGNPELEVGDIVELETPYSSLVYGLMLTDEITYNGALSGKVKVKGLV